MLEGKKLLFVAHSQGNLFANAAYDYAKGKIGAASVKVLHVAPPTSDLRGAYILADADKVIRPMMLDSLAFTDAIPDYSDRPAGVNEEKDWLGHGFVEIYINPKLAISLSVKVNIDAALNSLVAPRAQAASGFFTATLTWNGAGDADLHTYEPGGSWVYYNERQGQVGYLDVDNTSADGPEHYYASCDTNKLQEGIYNIKVANFVRAEGRTATVQVASHADGVLATKSVILGNPTGPNPIYQMFAVKVSKDNATGKYQVSLSQ